MLLASPNVSIPLQALAANGDTSLFGQARIYDRNGAVVSTISLYHFAEGLYGTAYTPTVEGIYSVIYQFYKDVSHTIPADFEKAMETLDVNSERVNILRLLGLVYDNAVFDQQIYNGDNRLLSGRVRSYDSRTNALLAGTTGLLYTWFITAVYSGANLVDYKMTRDV